MSSQKELPPKTRIPEALMGREEHIDPYPWFKEMRQTEPVAYDSNRGVWDLFTYDIVEAVITDHETFNRDPTDPAFSEAITYVEPPKHTRLRNSIDEFFHPGELQEMKPELRDITTDLLDDALADDDSFDFATEFSIPFPVIVIAELLGVPSSKRDTFREWSRALVASPEQDSDAATLETVRDRKESVEHLWDYFEDIVAQRQKNPEDDLVSNLVHEKSDQLSHEEIVTMCFFLLMAGNVTTTNLISNAVWTFVEQGVYGDVRDGTLDQRTAIEEVLRYRSPVKGIVRVAREDVEVGGKQIAEGDPILAWLASANRDEAVFEDPDEFKPERSPNRHIAFGKGIHYCLGAPLAKLETKIALSVLFERANDVEFSMTDLEPFYSGSLNGPKQFPVTVTPP